MATINLEGAIVPVTGAASGIGLAICRRLRELGAYPILLDLNAGLLEAAARDLYQDEDGSRFAYVVDVCDARAMEQTLRLAAREHGSITHAVASAGIVGREPVIEMSDETWRSVLDVNLNGVFYFCREVGRQMAKQQRGSIVTISSVAGMYVREGRSAYSASKAGVILFTSALALELGPKGVRVNSVAPALIDTPIQKANASATVSAVAERTALKRMGTPEEVADAVVFLLSDMSSYITGHALVADGGLSTRYN